MEPNQRRRFRLSKVLSSSIRSFIAKMRRVLPTKCDSSSFKTCIICGKVKEARTSNPPLRRCEEAPAASPPCCGEVEVALIPDLPTHILVEIFLRLPIKSLYSCRCVCKSWYNLISDPHSNILPFTAEPLHVMMLLSHNQHKRPGLKLPFQNPTTLHFFEAQYDHNTYNMISLEFNQPDLHVENSCNGLICLSSPSSDDAFVIVCNPVTGYYVSVSSTKDVRYPSWSSFSYHLGYNPMAKQYKILRMRFWERDHPLEPHTCRADSIYTLGKEEETWKNIGVRRFDASLSSPSTLGNMVHWISSHEFSTCIISFNFDLDKFGNVPLPPHFVSDGHRRICNLTMGVLRGCLFVSHFTSRDSIEIWILNEYGVRESWTRDVIVEIPPHFARRELRALQYLENGELLILNGRNSFLKYNTDSKVFTRIDIFGEGTYPETICYCPSFVSLKDIVNAADVQVLNLKSRGRQTLASADDENNGEMVYQSVRVEEEDFDDDAISF